MELSPTASSRTGSALLRLAVTAPANFGIGRAYTRPSDTDLHMMASGGLKHAAPSQVWGDSFQMLDARVRAGPAGRAARQAAAAPERGHDRPHQARHDTVRLTVEQLLMMTCPSTTLTLRIPSWIPLGSHQRHSRGSEQRVNLWSRGTFAHGQCWLQAVVVPCVPSSRCALPLTVHLYVTTSALILCRYLDVIIDLSRAAQMADFRPSRLALMARAPCPCSSQLVEDP